MDNDFVKNRRPFNRVKELYGSKVSQYFSSAIVQKSALSGLNTAVQIQKLKQQQKLTNTFARIYLIMLFWSGKKWILLNYYSYYDGILDILKGICSDRVWTGIHSTQFRFRQLTLSAGRHSPLLGVEWAAQGKKLGRSGGGAGGFAGSCQLGFNYCISMSFFMTGSSFYVIIKGHFTNMVSISSTGKFNNYFNRFLDLTLCG